ncbi:hypothetical protein L2744_17500 [Shewanella profunda]|uniref:hypothetical protein n=1 Tax=Shewanella profunda TaxID=254793 RepID=UPI00201095FD|nr:hypothetical protein [Shewanella profunda]MCL1091365.1 hypothetical protein [Shewanella profunda]
MNYHHFRISKANFLFLLLKLFAFLAAVFLLAKLRYEMQTLAIMPGQLIDLVFLACCLVLGWMYRVGLDAIDLSHNQQKIKIKVAYNVYGFVFIKILCGSGQEASVRLWNPKNFKYSLPDGWSVECIFKSDNKMPKGGCRLIKS